MSFGNGSGSRKEIGGGAFSGGISGGNRLACAFFRGCLCKIRAFWIRIRCREFQNGIGTGRDCFYTACKKGLERRCCSCCLHFQGQDDLSDCAWQRGADWRQDDPDGAVAALWNPRELLFLGGAGSTTGGAGSGLLYAAGMVPAQKAASGVWISLAVIGIGCAVEGYVNPFILKAVIASVLGIGRHKMSNQDMVELVFPVPLSGIT